MYVLKGSFYVDELLTPSRRRITFNSLDPNIPLLVLVEHFNQEHLVSVNVPPLGWSHSIRSGKCVQLILEEPA